MSASHQYSSSFLECQSNPLPTKYNWAIVHQKEVFPYCDSQPAEAQTYKILIHLLS